MRIELKNRTLETDRPWVMGILNITPDSFSDGGKFFSPENALAHARMLTEEGADIIDVGGESTRPGAQSIGPEEEVERVLPIIQAIKRELNVMVSVDTSKESVARIAVEEGGADMINDISAFQFSPGMAETVARLGVPAILMHIQGTPGTMQKDPKYTDVIAEISEYFRERIDYAVQKGIRREKLIIDPGIGFGKRIEDNIEILSHLEKFHSFSLPIAIGLSRKSFLGKITGEPVPENRESETLAANIIALMKGAAIIRVHRVEPTVKAIRFLRAIRFLPESVNV